MEEGRRPLLVAADVKRPAAVEQLRVLGKQIGITGMAWLAVKTGVADKPADVSWQQIYGVAWLAGIGFTMSLFITPLAFAFFDLPFAPLFMGLIFFFPIFYMVLTSFKTDADAVKPEFLFRFTPTLENYTNMTDNYDYWRFATNSVITSVAATLFTLFVAVPCAYAMAFNPTRGTKDILMWMLSTKMLPAAAVLYPMIFLAKGIGLYDTHILINGQEVGSIPTEDSRGRPLTHPQGCLTVSFGEILPLAPGTNLSFDGRYFGSDYEYNFVTVTC